MSTVYGILGKNLYRMAMVNKEQVLPIENFRSSIYNHENTHDKHFTSVVKFNTGEFFQKQSNDSLYRSILEYIQISEIKSIETLYTEFKVGVDYTLTDSLGNVIAEGISVVPAQSRDVYITYPITDRNELPAKRAKLLESKINLSRFIPAKYGIMDGSVVTNYTFKINSISVFGNLTDKTKDQYIRHLNPSIINTTFSHESGTYRGIRKSHILIFDSSMVCQEFNPVTFMYKPNTITVDFSLLLDAFCEVYDDSEIWRLIERNGGKTSSDPYIYDEPVDPFRPVTDPNHSCPHNGASHGHNHGHEPYTDGMIPFGPKPGFKPGPIMDDMCGCHRPVHPPVHPCPPPMPPHCPGDCPPPVIPPVNEHPHHGHFHKGEWCLTTKDDPNVPPNEKFVVVADDISEEDFDAFTMVKYRHVKPFISDVQVGDYVYKQDTLYI